MGLHMAAAARNSGELSLVTATAQDMEIIVTADDLGICPARNRGILRAVRAGVVTSASLMANGVASSPAVRDFIAEGKQQQLGLHLNLTEGRPLSPARLVPSLLRCRLQAVVIAEFTIRFTAFPSGRCVWFAKRCRAAIVAA